MKVEEFNINPGEKVECKFTERSVVGELKIENRVFGVYLGNITSICIKDAINGRECIKRKFELIEV